MGEAKHRSVFGPRGSNVNKVGKGQPEDRVERSLYQRAVGYTYSSGHAD